jgi:hypothetical protein
MIKKERIAPVALMFIAAGLSFLVCEELSRKAPAHEEAASISAPSATQAIARAALEQPRNFAQRITQKISHVMHSSAHSAELMDTQALREGGLKTVQPESASAQKLDDEHADATITHGPLDLALQPAVIVLPKAQEPLASAGLYDKRTRQKL